MILHLNRQDDETCGTQMRVSEVSSSLIRTITTLEIETAEA